MNYELISYEALALTHVSNPNSHSLIHEIEDHNDDEVDARRCDGGGQLGCDVGADHLQLISAAVLHDASEGGIHR